MKIPGWSALVIVPAVILSASFNVIRDSESPALLGLIIGGAAFLIAFLAWGILALLGRRRR
jgi:hypothetical protein